jgi:hypothetical protein
MNEGITVKPRENLVREEQDDPLNNTKCHEAFSWNFVGLRGFGLNIAMT